VRARSPTENCARIASIARRMATEWQKSTEQNTPNDKSGEFAQNCNKQSCVR